MTYLLSLPHPTPCWSTDLDRVAPALSQRLVFPHHGLLDPALQSGEVAALLVGGVALRHLHTLLLHHWETLGHILVHLVSHSLRPALALVVSLTNLLSRPRCAVLLQRCPAVRPLPPPSHSPHNSHLQILTVWLMASMPYSMKQFFL